jgi:hypothetical protein
MGGRPERSTLRSLPVALQAGTPAKATTTPIPPGDEQRTDDTPSGGKEPHECTGQYRDLPEVTEGKTERDG